MIRKTLLALSLTTGATLAISTPAQAGLFHTHYCDCGHSAGAGMCGTTTTSGGTTTTSGGTTTTSGGTTTTSGGTTTTSGGTTSGGTTSGGTDVPEPGMLGLMGMGLIGVAYARRRKARA